MKTLEILDALQSLHPEDELKLLTDEKLRSDAYSMYRDAVLSAMGDPEYSLDDGTPLDAAELALRGVFSRVWPMEECTLLETNWIEGHAILHEATGIVMLYTDTWFKVLRVDLGTRSEHEICFFNFHDNSTSFGVADPGALPLQ